MDVLRCRRMCRDDNKDYRRARIGWPRYTSSTNGSWIVVETFSSRRVAAVDTGPAEGKAWLGLGYEGIHL